MKKMITLAVLGSALVFGNAFAASHVGAAVKPAAAASSSGAVAPMATASADKLMGKQQSKMAGCNADAKEKALKGDERKKFMSSCLKGQSEAKATQQTKMKTCNKDARDQKLKGDERKKFMSSCLSA